MTSTSPLSALTAHMTPSQRDTMFTKIFVGGLPYHTTDESLRSFFQQFGEIEEAVVITDRVTAKSKGYGFVTMGDRGGAEKACEDPNPIIDGRKANVNLAYLGAKPRGIAGQDPAASLPLLLGGYQATSAAGLMQMGGYGYPAQYMYPSAAYLAAAASPQAAMPMRVPTIHPLSLASMGSASQLDQSTSSGAGLSGPGLSPVAAATAAAAAARLPAGYESPFPFVSTAGYMSPSAYAYAGMPAQQLTQLAAYQQQQQAAALQDQLQ